MQKSIKLSLLVFLIGFFLVTSCKQESKKVIKTTPIDFTKEGTLTIYKGQTDSIIASFVIEIAESAYETETGLMYRKKMLKEQAMLFIFPDYRQHYFHMKNTEFPLDIIFISDDMKIASFQENAKPHSEELLPSQVPAKYALEINGGLSEKFLLEVGDRVAFNKI